MIENFQISNFKGFNEPLKIDIAPITLIFGPNSSGKSSVINSLEMIKYSGPNTLQSYIENLLDLGKTEDIISRQNKTIHQIDLINFHISVLHQLEADSYFLMPIFHKILDKVIKVTAIRICNDNRSQPGP